MSPARPYDGLAFKAPRNAGKLPLMYVPPHYHEQREDVIHALIDAHPFATLVAPTADGFSVDHLPLLLERPGVLRGHVARANPLWRDARSDEDAVAVFHGPDGYISPAWYPSKQESGKVVPTWNYVVVHVRGRLRFIEDPAWLIAHVTALSARHEAGRASPWQVSDAPADYVTRLLHAIVGLELSITALEGKWKVGQNRDEADRRGAASGLRAEGTEVARDLARLMDDVS
jgi:transcriptional regulator